MRRNSDHNPERHCVWENALGEKCRRLKLPDQEFCPDHAEETESIEEMEENNVLGAKEIADEVRAEVKKMAAQRAQPQESPEVAGTKAALASIGKLKEPEPEKKRKVIDTPEMEGTRYLIQRIAEEQQAEARARLKARLSGEREPKKRHIPLHLQMHFGEQPDLAAMIDPDDGSTLGTPGYVKRWFKVTNEVTEISAAEGKIDQMKLAKIKRYGMTPVRTKSGEHHKGALGWAYEYPPETYAFRMLECANPEVYNPEVIDNQVFSAADEINSQAGRRGGVVGVLRGEGHLSGT